MAAVWLALWSLLGLLQVSGAQDQLFTPWGNIPDILDVLNVPDSLDVRYILDILDILNIPDILDILHFLDIQIFWFGELFTIFQ